MKIGAHIKEARERSGVTRVALAVAIGKHPNSVANWERDVYQPDEETLEAIATYLERPIHIPARVIAPRRAA